MPIYTALGHGTLETLVHAWDIATAAGMPNPIPAQDAATLVDELRPASADLHRSGMFAPPVPGTPPTDPLLALLTMTGRQLPDDRPKS
jgi:hypothetical protein